MMIELDGKNGGGQILRSALTLSMLTGQAFRMVNIRGGRKKPGLMRQHLTCVQAAVAVSDAAVSGAEMNSTELVFKPGKVRAGDYHFKIGTAGSTTLLAQTLLPVLWGAEGDSSLILEGGTHNPLAPSMDFITQAYLPALARMGLGVEGKLEKYGFAPAGGGRISFKIAGGQTPRQVDFLEKGKEMGHDIICLLANVPEAVGERETETLRSVLGWAEATVEIISPEKVEGSGNTLSAAISYENVTELITTHGAFGKPAEKVAREVAKMMTHYLNSGATVGRHLADQLILPMAIAGGGSLHTVHVTNHLQTNVDTIGQFLAVEFTTETLEAGGVKIVIRA